ncbi:MAG TPA: glycine cleavage T C-terminal barrel domain-containing protein [Methylomirabilota bacterium]|jgi:folate-binding protein YgfZ
MSEDTAKYVAGPPADYVAARRSAAVMDRSADGVVEVTGRDRASFLHALLSNDVKSLAPGEGCAAALLDVHGKVRVLLRVLVLDDRVVVLTPPGMGGKTVEALDAYLFSEKADLRDATGERALFMVVGPEGPALVERLAGVRSADAPWSSLRGVVAGAEVLIVRGGGDTGGPEVWLLGRAADAPAIWGALLAAGAHPLGGAAFDALRVEAGTALYGHDVDDRVLLPEIPAAHLVSHGKGCYVGQEVVVRIRDRGHVNRHLRGLILTGTRVPDPGSPVFVADREIGAVTSAAWSPGLEKPIALAFVRREYAEPGTAVTVLAGDARIPAEVSALPFAR